MLPTGHHAPAAIVQANHAPAPKAVVKPKVEAKPQRKPAPEPAVVAPNPPAPATRKFIATEYTALCSTGCTGITALGFDVRHTIYHGGLRVIAVDPAVIALGSIVHVRLANGSEFDAIAGDTGSAIKNRRIDILVSTRAEAFEFGRQEVDLRIENSGAMPKGDD